MNDPILDPEDTAETEASAPEPVQTPEEILAESGALRDQLQIHGGKRSASILEKADLEKSLKPFQAELILMQKYLEESKRRMIILFEGRDASGKGGPIRRFTRYMNEIH